MIKIPGHGLYIAGHNTPRADVLAAARADLIAAGMQSIEVDNRLAQSGVVAAAWWAGAEIGFCAPDHPDAVPVTVVNVVAP